MVAQIGPPYMSHVTDLAFINIIKSSSKVRLRSKKTATSSSLCSLVVPLHRELTLSSPTERFWAPTRNRYIMRQHVHARAVSTRVRIYVCPPSPLSSQDEKKREQKMAADALLVREGVAMGIRVSVICLLDRRDDGSTEPCEWTFQRQVEAALYGNGYSQQTGAVYRLLQRSGAGGRSLPLKKASIRQGIVTHEEFDWMYSHLRDVRSFTLIPVDALRVALSVFGQNERSEALVAALGIQKPDDWEDGEDGEEGGEEGEEEEEEEEEQAEQEEEEEGDGGGGDGSGEGGGGDGDGDSDAVEVASIAATEVVDEHPVVGDGDEEEEDTAAPPEPACGASGGHAKKRQHIEKDVSPTLVRELDALDAHRSAALNLDRQGVSVVTATREADRARLTRFLVWVNATYTLKSPATLSIFAHSKIGAAAQRYIKELVETHERKYSYGMG